MSSSREKGTKYETSVVRYLQAGGIYCHRTGSAKQAAGDIEGVEIFGQPVVVECKNAKTLRMATWKAQLEAEMALVDTPYGVIVMHQEGNGERHRGEDRVWLSEALEKIISTDSPYCTLEEFRAMCGIPF